MCEVSKSQMEAEARAVKTAYPVDEPTRTAFQYVELQCTTS